MFRSVSVTKVYRVMELFIQKVWYIFHDVMKILYNVPLYLVKHIGISGVFLRADGVNP